MSKIVGLVYPNIIDGKTLDVFFFRIVNSTKIVVALKKHFIQRFEHAYAEDKILPVHL